ncbi:MAG: hypothetical protein SVC26_09340 [Pseudomonadota bacterium]|nr:hypothetical protein [Pseudomonadota bacterium]
MRLELGDRNTRAGAVAFNAPLIDEMLTLRISGELLNTDGFVSNPTRNTNRYDAREQKAARVALRFDPSKNIDSVLKFSHQENYGGHDFIEYENYPEERINTSDHAAREGSTIDSLNLRVGLDALPELRFESETTYFQANYDRLEDFDNSQLPLGTLYRFSDIESVETELKALVNLRKLSLVAGVFLRTSLMMRLLVPTWV